MSRKVETRTNNIRSHGKKRCPSLAKERPEQWLCLRWVALEHVTGVLPCVSLSCLHFYTLLTDSCV